MAVRSTFLLLVILVSSPARAQHGGGTASFRSAPREAAQFRFLVGQWELVVRPAASGLAQKIHGVPKLVGTWKAWRAFDGFGVEDEMRITDEAGNPRSLSHAMRYYDAAAMRWTTSALDVYRGAFTMSTALWRDSTMTVTSRGADGEGKPYLSRARYSDITPTGFRFRQDRSMDNGVTWTEGVLTIEARRVAATAPR